MTRAVRLCSSCNGSLDDESPGGALLEGREILVRYSDNQWYHVIVVRYYPLTNEYKIVYKVDDGLEVLQLLPGRWMLLPKHRPLYGNLILQGAIIEFTYPTDGRRHRGMIYDYAHHGERIKIAYLEEDHTDVLKGNGWDFISTSPCIMDKTQSE